MSTDLGDATTPPDQRRGPGVVVVPRVDRPVASWLEAGPDGFVAHLSPNHRRRLRPGVDVDRVVVRPLRAGDPRRGPVLVQLAHGDDVRAQLSSTDWLLDEARARELADALGLTCERVERTADSRTRTWVPGEPPLALAAARYWVVVALAVIVLSGTFGVMDRVAGFVLLPPLLGYLALHATRAGQRRRTVLRATPRDGAPRRARHDRLVEVDGLLAFANPGSVRVLPPAGDPHAPTTLRLTTQDWPDGPREMWELRGADDRPLLVVQGREWGDPEQWAGALGVDLDDRRAARDEPDMSLQVNPDHRTSQGEFYLATLALGAGLLAVAAGLNADPADWISALAVVVGAALVVVGPLWLLARRLLWR